ncbi:MAG: DUF4332 domain-containing protein [Planctomycetota bacterium]|nr:DUF4332 domain-containing protein [Planctomycetota bacterium]
MNYQIEDVEGIGPAYGELLAAAGIRDTESLLEACGSKSGRVATAERTNIPERLLLGWSNLADLMRIKGIGCQYAELLEAAGVDTVKELRTRRADNLAARMAEVNEVKRLAKSSPAQSVVGAWIVQANKLEALLSY